MAAKHQLDVSEAIRVHGETYYIRIRSNNEAGPVALFLHGGCGSADRPFVMKFQSPLAEHCTIVAWDQRGAGMAYDPKKAKTEDLTKEQYIQDTHNVIQHLKERFGKEKIILVGHSFGSQLGVWVTQRYPEDVECFVGVGQVVGTPRAEEISFQFTIDEATKRGHKRALKKLYEVGPPVNGFYKDNRVLVQRNYLNRYGGVTYATHGGFVRNTLPLIPCMFREYSIGTMLRYMKANMYCLNTSLAKERINFFEEARALEVPVYLFMGHHDYNTPFELAEEWFNILQAPSKQLVWFERSAHEPQWEEPEEWNRAFQKVVLKII